MTNRYGGTCYKCGLMVEPGAGRTWRAGRRWMVACSGCKGKRDEAPGGSVVAQGPSASAGAQPDEVLASGQAVYRSAYMARMAEAKDEDLADPGAAGMEAALGIDEVRAPARRKPTDAEARETADARHERRAEEARAAVTAGEQPGACCTCGANLELFEQERAHKQCLGCRRDLPGHRVPQTPKQREEEADRAEDDGGGPYPERLRARLEPLGVTEYAAA